MVIKIGIRRITDVVFMVDDYLQIIVIVWYFDANA